MAPPVRSVALVDEQYWALALLARVHAGRQTRIFGEFFIVEFKGVSSSSTLLKNRQEGFAGLARLDRRARGLFRRTFLRGSRELMAWPRQRRCVWRFAAAEWQPHAARRSGQRGLRSRLGVCCPNQPHGGFQTRLIQPTTWDIRVVERDAFRQKQMFFDNF